MANPENIARRLTPDELRKFDADFRDWGPYADFLLEHLAGPPRAVLDVGGGNGRFLDALLELFPDSEGVLVDSAAYMIDRNRPHPRKALVRSDVAGLSSLVPKASQDLITVNVLLHHLVGETAQVTWVNGVRCLAALAPLLTPQGRVVVYEQIYEGRPFGPEPGDLIYRLTRMRHPLAARMFKSLGSNSAGVGVHFRSRAGWRAMAAQAGLTTEHEATFVVDRVRPLHRYPLNIGERATHVFMLRRADS